MHPSQDYYEIDDSPYNPYVVCKYYYALREISKIVCLIKMSWKISLRTKEI